VAHFAFTFERTTESMTISDIAGLATAFAVLLAAGGLFAQIHQRKFSLAQVYVQRYWEVDEPFLSTPPPPDGSSDAKRYLRLCEDEYDVAKLGWVDVGVWKIWHQGIRTQVKNLSYDTQDFANLSECINGPSDHLARNCPGLEPLSRRRRLVWRVEELLSS
jgi:hypothetical protein